MPTDLITRIESAGPDEQRELLIEAFIIVYPGDNRRLWSHFQRSLNAEAYIDAALMLLPEGLSARLYIHPDEAHCDVYRGHPGAVLLGEAERASTPALALLAAILKVGG